MKNFAKIISVAMSAVILCGASQIIINADEMKQTESKKVVLGGQPFGVKFYNSGVIVIELEEFYDGEHYVCPAKKGGIKVNDIIKKVNGNAVTTNEELQSECFKSDGKTIEFTVERNGQTIKKEITPVKNTAGAYLLGAWVRDSSAGIGTITYYDRVGNYFAALGHGICDNETMALLPLGSAEVVGAQISSITKSSSGRAGSLNGYFTEESIGKLTKNSNLGIYGFPINLSYFGNRELEIAENSEISKGEAQLYTAIEDDKTGCYSIEITELYNMSDKSNENFVIKITDEKLLEKCGGIVQGMSGSPIVQNGKLVGAVTHVFLNSPNEGFAVTAQNMVANY